MAARGFLLALLLVGTGFAGCISGDGGDELGTATTNNSSVNTEAPEGRGTIVAFEETNQTEEGVGGVDHHHDYWAGRGRVTIFETSAAMEPFVDTEGAYAEFRPPQGTFIYEATEAVEFTLSSPKRHVCAGYLGTLDGQYVCSSNLDYFGAPAAVPSVDDPTGGPSGLKLRYMHASTTQWIDAGEITWGTPVIIKITDPIQTDMPHATSSVWQFQVYSPHPEDATLTFDAKAEIVRGPVDIPLWPGHPLFYTPEKPSRVISNNVMGYACDTTGCIQPDEEGPVVPEKIISYGTRTLYVWVNITEFVANNPATAPNSWFIYHVNATGRSNITNPFDQENYGIEKRELHWVLPVDDGSMDSPYADGSRWWFELGASLTTPVVACYGGCADWSAKYTMTIIASSEELPLEQYHMSCLSDDDYCPTPDTAEGGGSPERQYVRKA